MGHSRWGKDGLSDDRGRERFRPGKNEGGEEGLYKSSDLTGEKAQGCG